MTDPAPESKCRRHDRELRGAYAWRFEVAPGDQASGGTGGGNLFQRKYDDEYVAGGGTMTWLSINVHGSQIDATRPGRADGAWETPTPLRDLASCVGTWTRFTVHERLDAQGNGLAEITVDDEPAVTVVADRPTFPVGDVLGHFQYGYYRSQFAADGTTPLAAGTVLHTPLLIAAAPSAPPVLP